MTNSSPAVRATLQALAKSQEVVKRAANWHEANRKQIEQIQRSVRRPVVQAAAWTHAHRDQIESVVKALEQFDRQAEQIEEEWGNVGLGYLVAPLGIAEQLVLSLHAAPGNTEDLFEFLESALADPEFVERTSEALDNATVLSDVSRNHLKHGLAHFSLRESMNAWPPLVIGLEGAFVDVATDQGIAIRQGNHVYFADANGRPAKKLSGVEAVAKELGHADEDSDFGAFLVRKVYGGEGNPFRHGTARDGVRERAICLAVAVLGWLDAFVTPGSRDLLRDAVAEELSRRDELSERLAAEGLASA